MCLMDLIYSCMDMFFCHTYSKSELPTSTYATRPTSYRISLFGVRGGWGLDALRKVFRRRRRPPGFGKWAVIGFHYDFGASGVRGSIRLVFRVPLERELRKVVIQKNKYQQNVEKSLQTVKNNIT